jgi:hypothetical protein
MYSDLRKAANNAYIILQSYRKVALCFGLAHSTVWRWLMTRKKETNLQKPHGEWIRCAMVTKKRNASRECEYLYGNHLHIQSKMIELNDVGVANARIAEL